MLSCGRLGFDASSDDSAIDAAPELDAESTLGAFGAIENVPGIASIVDQDDPSLTADELIIVFQRSGDLWIATRSDRMDAFGDPAVIAEVSTGDGETTPELSEDGLTLYFGRSVGGGRSVDIFVASRANRTAAFDPPMLIEELSTTRWEAAAAPTVGGNRLIFSRDFGTDANSNQLFLATRTSSSSPWSPIELEVPVNSPAVDSAPFINAIGTLYFATTRNGGEREIWRSKADGDSFAEPQSIEEVNGSFKATDPWVSPDGRRIYYMTDEAGVEEIVMRSR